MANVRAARSLPYGVVQVSHQLPWPEQPAGEQQAMGTGTQEEASSHHQGVFPALAQATRAEFINSISAMTSGDSAWDVMWSHSPDTDRSSCTQLCH